MWTRGWREQAWSHLDHRWDLIIIGGGITGAGILREAVRAGLRALLVERGDFACGTSSRSSKLVHGGFRYLKQGEIRLTLESVRERERLLKEGRGLITRLGFLLANYRGDGIPPWVFGLGLTVYDLLALRWSHQHYDARGLQSLCPPLNPRGLLGGYRYIDAWTDDARLVLRVLQEAVDEGGVALNYAPVVGLLRARNGRVCGVSLRDDAHQEGARELEVPAALVVNATGVWADDVRAWVNARPRLRHLRGSHLLFHRERLPITRAVSFLHPTDGRPVFAYPWEGVTLLGTTDVDQGPGVPSDPAITEPEVGYLLAAAGHAFPELALSASDVRATFSGVRAVLDTGRADPSKEPREHILWQERGLLTVTGGKLTTFRRMALHALRAARRLLPHPVRADPRARVLDTAPDLAAHSALDPGMRLRLAGRYGRRAETLLRAAHPEELEPIGDSPSLWAEVRWAVRAEGVVHLDDLLLRRVRLGLQLPEGGLSWIGRLRSIAQPELGWDDARWEGEVERYRDLWRQSYAPPG